MSVLQNWAENNLLSLQAEHLTRVRNEEADWLHQQKLRDSDLRLNPRMFVKVVPEFGKPVIDLSALPKNAHVPRFLLRLLKLEAEGINALQT